MDDRGLYHKFDVKRTDGTDQPGGKHEGCRYFVIDVDHDENAPYALSAYIKRCRAKRPVLAADLERMVSEVLMKRFEAQAGEEVEGD